MKKAVLATMLSVSMLAAPVAQAQAQIYDGTTHAPTATDMEQNGIGSWLFQGVTYYVLDKALDAAWEAIMSYFAKDREDGCQFYQQHAPGSCPAACDGEGDGDGEWEWV